MEAETQVWSPLLYSWAPILLMIVFWLFFMKRRSGPESPAGRTIANMERQNQLLERIAAALEERNRRGD